MLAKVKIAAYWRIGSCYFMRSFALLGLSSSLNLTTFPAQMLHFLSSQCYNSFIFSRKSQHTGGL